MRYCSFCGRLNPGRPLICHYCGRTWYIRLCPRGHENPPNAQFCGTCGSMDLSETAGPRPWGLYALKILIFAILCLVIFSFGKFVLLSLKGGVLFTSTKYLFAIILLMIGYCIAISFLPQPIKRMFMRVNGYLLKAIIQAIVWVCLTIKEIFNLLLNW
jgi:hypothetical protein